MRWEITQEIQVTWNMYNISNTNNIWNMGHLRKEQFTWQFGNMAGVTMFWQLPFNSSQTCGLGSGGGLVSTPGVFSQFGRKCLVRKLCSKEQHPPSSYPVVIFRSNEANLSHVVWIKICNC